MKNQKSNLYSRLNLALLSILFSIFLFQFSCTQNTASNKLKINEVWTKGGDSPVGGFLHNFVELYNKDSVAISVSGWTLANRTGAVIATLPNWVLPPKTYLTVYFGSGQDDDDFSDREGSYYTQGDSLNIFDDVMDEVGLYTGRPSGSSIIDFVAWSNTGNYTPGVAHAHALSKGIWTQGDFVDRSGYGILSSHGLCPDGFDHNVSGDWREYDWGTYFISTTHSGPNPIQLSPLDGQILSALQVNFLWAAVDSALSYRLQVDDDSTFVSPEIDTVLSTTSYSDRLAPGDYYWRVRVIDRQGLVEEAAIWSFGIFPVLPPGPPARRLNVPSLFQHKDTDMLCLTDDTGLNPRIRRPGCSEFPSNSGPWDGAHPNNHALVCPHCGWYCVRASLAMINRYYGGDMSQDRISYQACKDLTAGEPEQDLGHERGLYFVPDEITPVYSWVLNGAAVAFRLGKPSFNTIRNEIDANRPIGIVIPGHMMVLDGYRVSPQNQVYILDPWPTGSTGWNRYSRVNIIAYWTIGAGVVTGRNQEASVTIHSDGDGVVDFDEEVRFTTDKANPDTDLDDVNDKKDVRSYTFHEFDGCHDDDYLRIADWDQDGLRAEKDCDSDNDSDFDGGEDINGDGICRNGGSETDALDQPGEFYIKIDTDKDVYQAGENVILFGGTFHENSIYPYDIILGCPDLVDSAAIGQRGLVNTDLNGEIQPFNLGGFPPGEYLVVVDVLRDQLYSEPDNWDPWVCFEVLPREDEYYVDPSDQ